MGQNELIMLALLAAPVLLLMVLRVNATMVFLSLCLGYVLMQFLGTDGISFAKMFLSERSMTANVVQLSLLLFPAVFTLLFMIHTVRGGRLLLNVLPALAVGCLSLLFVVPLLPGGTAHAITNLTLWHQALRLQSGIVGAGALISLLFLWTQRPRARSEPRAKRKGSD